MAEQAQTEQSQEDQAQHSQEDPSLRDQARALKEDWKPEHFQEQLDDAVSERPMVRHLLDFGIVLRAVAIAAVVTIVLLIVTSAAFAAIGLVVVFFGSWLLLARLSYDQRRETREADDVADGDDDDAESDSA